MMHARRPRKVAEKREVDPGARADTLTRLTHLSYDPRVHCGVASNPAASADTLRKLAEEHFILVDWMLLDNPNLPEDVLVQIVDNGAVDVRGHAGQITRDKTLMMRLAQDPSGAVRLGVAKNVRAGEDVFQVLLRGHPAEAIREAIAKNEATPKHLLDDLAMDPSLKVRAAVFTNVNY